MEKRRRAYLKASLRGREAFWAMFAGIALSGLAGAYAQDPRMLAGIPLTALAIFAVSYVNARQRAATEFFAELAPQLGLEYTGGSERVSPVSLLDDGDPEQELDFARGAYANAGTTPLLGAGDRRRHEHTMEGPLLGKLGGPHCAISHYTFERRQNVHEEVAVWKPVHFTVCTVDVGGPLDRFRGLFLQPRLSGLGLQYDWLARAPKPQRVELESARFNELYVVSRAGDQDELALRELFSPSFVVWLNEHPLQPGFECKGGTLVVYMRGHEQSAGRITLLHEAAREITRRLAQQVEQGGLGAPRLAHSAP